MPPRPPRTDWRFPEMLAGLGRLPQSEVSHIGFLIAVHVHARARLNPAHINLGKLAVGRKFRDPEIDGTVAAVGKRLGLQPLDQAHHVRNVVGRAHPAFRRFHPQRLAIRKKSLRVFFRILADSDACRRCIRNNPVVHVGQVHHMLQPESPAAQKPPQDVLKYKCAVIPDVREVVDGRAAGVHAHFARRQRHERLFLSGQRIVKNHLRHRSAPVLVSKPNGPF